jgi:hypothetical protein
MPRNSVFDIHQQFQQLWRTLYRLGANNGDVLLQLTNVIQPDRDNDGLRSLLQRLSQEAPQLLADSTGGVEFAVRLHAPQKSSDSLRVLLNFRELQELLNMMSDLQTLTFANNIVPFGSHEAQCDFMQRIQATLQLWSDDSLQHVNRTLTNCTFRNERETLIAIEPNVPLESLHFTVELLKLPLHEVTALKHWFTALSGIKLSLFVRLIQLDPATLMLAKQALRSDVPLPPLRETLASLTSNYNVPRSAALAPSAATGAPSGAEASSM